ncbi:DHA2 family efflux MFS transporter permease subunit [Nocardia huaxiensis]|uniref:DHA2 family efflux MFS transporter permease subunit n=1 Tax=Nocardia huaxiensis TaxID=2755382 RepID=A0A7D6VIN6_9NOCA|nr:DHA2 family efflux MFS transporter permease subunit [Nocardia huaxiensis]QLY33815.1 DHA2 family efflux MFS transporter permease subunit [Nocardia huaxiensis]UFS99260.1 DHA2 family efflux MFS transporter permease subunit [Nocardia huaxiensis]
MTSTLTADGPGAGLAKPKPLAAVIAAVGIPMFMVTLDNLVVTNALPIIRTELNASLTDLQWFVNAYTLAFASMLLTAAALGDRLGRRRVFLAGIALFTVASAACALATEPWQLIAARAVQGFGGAAVLPLSLTLLSAAVPEKMRSAAIGIWGGITGLGVALGPVVGGAVVEGLSWQWIFWLNVPIGILAVPFAARMLSESFGGVRRLDLPGLLLSSGGVLAVVWGVVHGADDGWTSGKVLGGLIGGAVLLAAFIAWELRNPEPMLPLRLFRSRGFSVINTIILTFSVGVFGAIFLLAQFFQVVQGYSPLEAGVRTLPWTMAPMVVAPIAGLIVDKVGPRILVGVGQFFLAVALGWMALVTSVDMAYSSLLLPFVLGGVGMGLTFAPSATVVMASAAPDDRAMASGVNSTLREVGVALGIAVLASVFASHGSYVSPQSYVDGLVPAVWVGAAVVAVGAVISLFLPGRRAITAATETTGDTPAFAH